MNSNDNAEKQSVLAEKQILLKVSEVARMLDITPAMIRRWERYGLFTPVRAANNYRVYTIDDVEKLRKIKVLSQERKMNASAIKILDSNRALHPHRSPEDANPSRQYLGRKWKERRIERSKTLEEVSEEAGISVSYLSKIENGQANVSYEILNRLADYYGESLLFFLERDVPERKQVKRNMREIVEGGLRGVKMTSLISVKDHIFYPMLFEVEPGCGSSNTHRHHGEEFIFILSGALTVTLNNHEVYTLTAGDSLYFHSLEYHSWVNDRKKTTRLIWVHSPAESLF